MVSTGIYVRVSTDEQAREGYSIRAQEEKLRAYAKLKDWHVYSIYSDEGISGKDIDGRPEMKRLIADVVSGKIKNVLVFKIDRLTRSTKNLIELVEIFNDHDCAFNSLNEAIDTSSATGRMFLKIVGIFAEFERENLAERVRVGLERKAKEGYSNCGFITSYGYDREKGNKIQEINESEAIIVRRIFDMYLNDNYCFDKIAKTLNVEGVVTKKGKQWKHTTVRKVLTNPNMTGKVRYACKDPDRYFEADGHHKPIIDEKTYLQVQEKYAIQYGIGKTKRPTSGVYFCGVLYCPYCGNRYTTKWSYKPETGTDGRRDIAHANYKCVGCAKGLCSAKQMSHFKVEVAFENYIEQISDFTENANLPTKANLADHTQDIEAVTAEIGQIEGKASEIMRLFATNTIDFDTYQSMTKFNNEKRTALQTRLNHLQNKQQSSTSQQNTKEILQNFKENWRKLNNNQRQVFVQKFIKKIVFHNEPCQDKLQGEIVISEIEFNDF